MQNVIYAAFYFAIAGIFGCAVFWLVMAVKKDRQEKEQTRIRRSVEADQPDDTARFRRY